MFTSQLLQFYAWLNSADDSQPDFDALFKEPISETTFKEADKESLRVVRSQRIPGNVSDASPGSVVAFRLDKAGFDDFCDQLRSHFDADKQSALAFLLAGCDFLVGRPANEASLEKLNRLFSYLIPLSIEDAESFYESDEAQEFIQASIKNYAALSAPLVAYYQHALAALGDVPHPENLLPLYEKSWIDSFVKTAAFLLWLLEKKVSANQIITSGMLDKFVLYHCVEIDRVAEFYRFLQGYDVAKPLVKVVDTALVPRTADFRSLISETAETRLTGLRVALEHHGELSETPTAVKPSFVERIRLSFDIPELHNPVLYEKLFGNDYWFFLIAHYAKQRQPAIEKILRDKFNVEESATSAQLKQLNEFIVSLQKQDNKAVLLQTVANLLTDKTAKLLIERGNIGVFFLVPHKLSLLSLLSEANASDYIDNVVTSSETDLDKIGLLFTLLTSLPQSSGSLPIQKLLLAPLIDLLFENHNFGLHQVIGPIARIVQQYPELQLVVQDKLMVLVEAINQAVDSLSEVNQDSIRDS